MLTQPGTYALIMVCPSDQQIEIGKLGRLHARPGFFVYIGSAFGPGGLKARIAHHVKISHRPHWHIDYFRSVLHLTEVWYTLDTERHEHLWADTVCHLQGATIPMIGFGASDCSCTSHLFRFTMPPSIRSFRCRLRTHFNAHGSILQHTLAERTHRG